MVHQGFPSLGLAAIWGVRSPGRRGPAPALTIHEIVAAAADVADAEGVAAVTVSAVAARLGSATNSLYRYIGSKDELLLLMFDHGVGPPPERLPSGDWRAAAREWMESLIDRYAARPWLLEVRLPGPPMTPNTLAWLDALLAALEGSPWGDDDALQLATLLDRLAHAVASLKVGVLDSGTARPAPEALFSFLRTQASSHGLAHVEQLMDRGVYRGQATGFDLDHALRWLFSSDGPN